MAAISYSDVGVNRGLADQLVDRISVLSKSTLNRRIKASVGGYASLYELDKKRWIAASTDGVGTKLKLAFQLKHHRTVGIDLVAMSVNDLLCVGAEPLFFLDYFATGRLELNTAEEVIEGIVAGCQQAQCALVGGETAEMPDFYSPGEYDLGGFCVGTLNPKQVLPRKDIRKGDVIIGLRSSGVHSNGFSLIRQLIAQKPVHDSLIHELLIPTRIYVNSLLPLIQKGMLKGLAHVTGSGFLNVPRISDRVSYQMTLPKREERPAIFNWLRETSISSFSELATTFNLGIGMVAVVDPKRVATVMKHLKRAGEMAWILGEVIPSKKAAGAQVILSDEGESATLSYT